MSRVKWLFSIGMLALLATGVPQAAEKAPPVKKLALKKEDGVDNGRIAFVEARTGPQERRYLVTNVLVTQPVRVTLDAVEPGDDLQLRVSKSKWSEPVHELSTGGAGRAQVTFRTQGEFGVAVSGADAGKPYRLAVWVGDEVRRPMRSVVVPKSQWNEGDTLGGKAAPAASEGLGWAVWLGLGLLAIIAALLAVIVLRKKGEEE